jgi:Protein of unknown function (DUF2505)
MKFSHQMMYDAGPAEVRAMIVDPEFREKVCQAIGTVRHSVRVEGSGDEVGVTVDQTQSAHELPSFARKFVGNEIRIIQRETWREPTRAGLDLEIPGKPGRLTGGIVLDGDDDGTVEELSGDLKVGIPLIGGKLEEFVGDIFAAALRIEEKVGRQWLAGER